jgi:hypothetical protein
MIVIYYKGVIGNGPTYRTLSVLGCGKISKLLLRQSIFLEGFGAAPFAIPSITFISG